jgi:16S rRNA C1402 (ribose-2'-O) methylase RsmI
MLLYLDVDGVMVPANSWRKPEILEDGFPEFSPNAVRSLKRIISHSSANIVLTTSHKHKYTLKEWNTIFKRRNINVNKITRLPKNTNHLNRKEELINWFTANHIKENFIIIDDDKSLNGLPKYLKNKLIQTSGSVGLTDYLAEEALINFEKSLKELVK